MKHLFTTLLLLLGAIAVTAQNITPAQDSKKGTWGYQNAQGKWAVKPKFESATPFESLPGGRIASRVTLKGLTGFVGDDGKLIGPGVVFESVEPLDGDAMLVSVKGKKGVFRTTDGTYIIKPELTSTEPLDNGAFLVNLKGKQGIMDTQGRYLVAPVNDNVDTSLNGYYRIYKGGKCSIAKDNGDILIPAGDFTQIQPFGPYWKVSKKDKTGLYSATDHTLVTKVDFEDVGMPIKINRAVYYPVKKKSLWGVLNSRGKEEIKNRYEGVSYLKELGAILLQRSGNSCSLWYPDEGAFIDAVIKTDRDQGPFHIIQAELTEPDSRRMPNSYRFYRKRFTSPWLTIITDPSGNAINATDTDIRQIAGYYAIPTGKNRVDLYSADGKLFGRDFSTNVKNVNGWKVFDTKAISPEGKIVKIEKTGNLTAVKSADGKLHLFKSGKIAENGYKEIKAEDNYYHVSPDGSHWGLLKADGTEIIPCEYTEEVQIKPELKAFEVQKGKYTGFIHMDGTVILEPKYEVNTYYTTPDKHAYLSFIAEENGKQGIINGQGQIVLPIEYKIEEFGTNNNLSIESNGLYGLCTCDGKILAAPQYTSMKEHSVNGGNIWIQKNGKYGVMDSNGNVLIAPLHNDADLQIFEDNKYKTTTGGVTKYYYGAGGQISGKPAIRVTYQSMDHNIYDANNNKSLRLNYKFESDFLLNKPIKVEARIYQANGKPAQSKRGGQNKWHGWKTPSYLFATWSDQWFTFPYTNFVQPAGTKRDYYIQLFFTDENGKPIPTTGNNRINFYLTR